MVAMLKASAEKVKSLLSGSQGIFVLSIFVTTQHNQFTAWLSRFGPAGTPSSAS
jgi:hypothetical protein